MTVLDHEALERARKTAGLLPSQLARPLGVSPRELLTDYAPDPPTCELAASLVALLYRDGVVSIDGLATRLATSPDGLLDAVDAYNHAHRGLKIFRWQDHVGSLPTPP